MEELSNKIRDLIANICDEADKNQYKNYQIETEIMKLYEQIPKEYIAEDQVSLVLTEDTHLELGNNSTASCRLLVPIEDSAPINDGKMTLVGPDISMNLEEKTTLPFAQIVFIQCQRPITPDLYRKIRLHLSVFNIINGFMIRAVPRKFWIRISGDLIKKDFNFETLAKFLVFHMKKKFLEIEKIELIFITTAEDKIEDLEKISSHIQELYADTKLRKKLKEIESGNIPSDIDDEKKRFDCDYEWSCNECEYNEVCDEIIDIIKKMRDYKKSKSE
jgi:CO dehydrogenase/acetyl-CoA synthase beta subunit